jgi:hypothetical protein
MELLRAKKVDKFPGCVIPVTIRELVGSARFQVKCSQASPGKVDGIESF